MTLPASCLNTNLTELPQLERTVRARATGYTHKTVVVVRKGEVLTEDGELLPVEEVNWRKLAPSLVVGVAIPRLVVDLTERYGKHPDWQWKAADRNTTSISGFGFQKTIVDFFGWKGDRKKPGHFHLTIDATTFYTNPYVLEDEMKTVTSLMDWARDLRTFAQENDLQLRSTCGAMSVQFLRDKRFYPNPRRKVPRFINRTAREQLPGNHYQLRVDEREQKTYTALEIDQTRAHHYHAENTRLPEANSLFARGDTRQLSEVTSLDLPSESFSGLLYVRLFDRTGGDHNYPIIRPGDGEPFIDRFIWSCEVPYLRDFGYDVSGIIATWGSNERDSGLRLYARHAQHELDRWKNASWVKPLLLSTYGILAAKPKVPESVFYQAESDIEVDLLAGGDKWLHGFLVNHTKGRKIEPSIANVLQRGLIEAATRAESLGLAHHLELHGVRVLQVYADSVIVEDDADAPLPFLPEPWRAKQRLTDFMPLNSSAFVSVEKERLPGISRDDRLRISRGNNRAPFKQRYEAISGRRLSLDEQRERGIKIRRV